MKIRQQANKRQQDKSSRTRVGKKSEPDRTGIKSGSDNEQIVGWGIVSLLIQSLKSRMNRLLKAEKLI